MIKNLDKSIGLWLSTSIMLRKDKKMKNLVRVTGVTQKTLGVISLFIIVSCSRGVQDERAFITTWRVTEGDLSITIPACLNLLCTNETYDYAVDWGDGTTDENQTADATHEYAEEGTYTVSITGSFPHIYFNNEGDKDKIIAINQWGSISWLSMNNAFYGCSNLEGLATDTPDLSKVTDMQRMFFRATVFNQDIGDWDVSNVTVMHRLFREATAFNQDIGNWDTSKVTGMEHMFNNTPFNQDIGDWDTSKVTGMESMFHNTPFNQDIGGWKTSMLTNMRAMFANTTAFDRDIGDWDTSRVTDMTFTFSEAAAFDQDIGGWKTSRVKYMDFMFANTTAFNQDISGWNVCETRVVRGGSKGGFAENAISFEPENQPVFDAPCPP